MTHADYIKKRDEILNVLDERAGTESGYSMLSDKDIAEAAQAIDALVLEVIGEDTYEQGMAGDDRTATRFADFVKSEQRKTVQGDK